MFFQKTKQRTCALVITVNNSARFYLLFTWKTHCGLKLHFGQFDRSEICTEVSFTSPEAMWTLIMKLPYIEVKFHLEMKSQSRVHLGSHVTVLLLTLWWGKRIKHSYSSQWEKKTEKSWALFFNRLFYKAL